MILIVSFEDNEHVHQVTRHLKQDYAVVDMAWFPDQMRLSTYTGADVDDMFLTLPDNRRIALNEVGSVWYRRIKPFSLAEELSDNTDRLFAWSESNEALLGAWYAMDCFWMNKPVADEVALRKVYQLRVAKNVGLQIPQTLVTNSPSEAREFIETQGVGKVIRKAFRNIPQAPRETLIVGPEELRLIDAVKYAPVIFQSFVPAQLDLRVTVIENEIFTAAVSSDDDHKVDYRSGLGTASVQPFQLPDDIEEKLHQLMAQMDLQFGAIDFRVTPEGEFVFLEINPAGEYLFISNRTHQPIPQAIAATLDRHARSNV